MSQLIKIHPQAPQARLIKQSVELLQQGGVVVYPTDTAYAIGCKLGFKKSIERIRQLRLLNDKHDFTLLCADLSQIATYAKVNNSAYRLLKSHTPGAYTFILAATKEVPKILMHAKKKTIGLRIPNNPIMQAILQEIQEPILTSTLKLPEDVYPMTDPYDIQQSLSHHVDLVIDGGYCGMEETTIINLTDDAVEIIRHGVGALDGLE